MVSAHCDRVSSVLPGTNVPIGCLVASFRRLCWSVLIQKLCVCFECFDSKTLEVFQHISTSLLFPRTEKTKLGIIARFQIEKML